MLSFPRTLALKQLNGQLTLVQQPVVELDSMGSELAQFENQTLAVGQTLLSDVYGKALDISVKYVPSPGSTLSLAVRVGGSERTVISCVQCSNQLRVDRTSSGDTSYDPAAGGVHTATFQAAADGTVYLRVLVNECSVKVFGGRPGSYI